MYINLFKTLADFDVNTGVSRLVCTNEFVGIYANLRFGNGGSWCRLDSRFSKMSKVLLVKKNGNCRFPWPVEEDEKNKLMTEVNNYFIQHKNIKKGNNIFLIKLCGFQSNEYKRPINPRIRAFFNNQGCVVCGSHSDCVIDHKNYLYNNPRVLNIETQMIYDFQVLCTHCNLQKRQVAKWTIETKKLYSAKHIPQLKVFGIDFISTSNSIDMNNINAVVGTYWYDPIVFMSYIKKSLSSNKLS
jgi:hypothetical protein